MNSSSEIELTGIDGGNPLGFLAAVGATVLAQGFAPASKLFWRPLAGAWRPVLTGCEGDPQAFLEHLEQALRLASTEHFDIDKRLPFEVGKLEAALGIAQREAAPDRRRTADFLAAFGSEAVHDKGIFEDTPFRMVRSGDSNHQGLPHYALAIRACTDAEALRRTLFESWTYQDVVVQDGKEKGYSLRWDPLEDQRYALRWKNPSKSSLADGPGMMLGANALALEALPLFPSVPCSGQLLTTGFHRNRQRQTFFTWPIWDRPISVDGLRSLLALAELREDSPFREELARRGIVEIYRCQRIAQNQYYSNFTPAYPT